ncbi:AT-rich interactive domain-containing protein 5A [Pholidichthys leucotaenia]
MAEEDQMSQQTAASDEENETTKQAPVIELHDSTTECEDEGRSSLVQMEEKAFVSRLHAFMKDKGAPIERIPHLGFKQINLWRIYKAVDKLGGYDSVTARRLWKKVYDELGGSPGSTSAATCTRRHYERLVLRFERHIKGEEDKPLPLSKPRKPYRRNSDGKPNKAEGKRKRTHSDREMDSEVLSKRSSEVACQKEAVIHPHSSLWAAPSDVHRSDCSQTNRATNNLCPSAYAHLLQVPTSNSWVAHIPSTTGEVISPLEKKKRMAQASLSVPPGPQSEDKERPSVIHCSQSPARASSGRNCNSSEGSPLPLSSSSSRSSSPYSVSSEDSPAGGEDKPTSSSEIAQNISGTDKKSPNSSEESKSGSSTQTSKDPSGQKNYISQVSSQSVTANPTKSHVSDSIWKTYHKGTGKYFAHPFHSLPAISLKSDWTPRSSSSFTKVLPKSVQPLRPAPIRLDFKVHPSRSFQLDNSLTYAKKLNDMTPWPYQTEKRDKSRTVQQKVPPAQQNLSNSTAALPMCFLPSYDKSVRDSRQQPAPHPPFLPSRMRPPASQLTYHHVPVVPAHNAFIGSPVYPYPYSIPLLNPQNGYAIHPIYPSKM